MSHQAVHEASPASADGPSDLGRSAIDTENRKAEGQEQHPPSGQRQVNASNASTEGATPSPSPSASAPAPAQASVPTPTGHGEEDKGTDTPVVERGEGAVRGGKRPPRPPGSIRQGRKDKRKAGWEAKKALAKEKKRAAREQR